MKDYTRKPVWKHLGKRLPYSLYTFYIFILTDNILYVCAHVSHLQCGDNFITFLIGIGSDGVPRVAVRVNNGVTSLPADDDGVLTPGSTV